MLTTTLKYSFMIAGVSYQCVPATGQEKPLFCLRRKPEPLRMQSQTLKMNLEGERFNQSM